jgi:C-terminal peptidase prc
MAHGQLGTLLRHLHRMLGGPDAGTLPDRQLLERFTADRDEDAFATLVRRHAPLVWGVCRRMLRHEQDAEDAFQATFLVLARRAGSVTWQLSVANWIYEVASRVAAEARTKNARRRLREKQVRAMPEEKAMPEATTRELCAVLDEELHRLPEKYRTPLLLCYLEGQATDQAARQLGWSRRTLQRRLAQGRERLRARLIRRGLTLSGVLLGIALSAEASRAAVPAGLAIATTKAVTSWAAEASATVLALAEAALKGMMMTKLKFATAVMCFLSVTAGAGALLATTTMRWPQAEPGNRLTAAGRRAPPATRPAEAEKEDPRLAEPPAADTLAKRVWAIMEVVAKNHVQPPSRKEMLFGGAKALLKAANAPLPEDLDRRVSAIDNDQQLGTFLRDIWPKDGQAQQMPPDKLETALLDGLFESIPGRPQFWPAAQIKRTAALAGNRYVGIGVQLAVNDREQLPQIVIPFRRGTARRAGARPGDLLLAIDGRSTHGMLDLGKVVALLQGAEGTSLTLVVRQPGAAETRTLKLTRAVIPFESVLGFRRSSEESWDYWVDKDAGIGYVWVRALSSSTLHELRQVEQRLQSDGLRALVLDFRFSAGEGHLHHAALVAGGLIDGGLLWTTTGKEEKPYWADREGLFRGRPLVVLVNDISDNAQGAVLAALQDNNRAILVGEPTKALGSIRMLCDLPNQDGAITVLTGQLVRAAKSRSWPVIPDRKVEMTKEHRSAVQKWLFDKQLPELPPGTDDRLPEDPQFACALAVLRDALKVAEAPGNQESAGRK